MQKLTVDTGVEEFTLNGRGPLRFNPGDPNVYHRFFEAKETLEEMGTSLRSALDDLAAAGEAERTEKSLALLAEYDRQIKEMLGRVFGTENDFDALLEGVNLAGLGANGRPVVQNLLDALAPVLEQGAARTLQTSAAAAVARADAASRLMAGTPARCPCARLSGLLCGGNP